MKDFPKPRQDQQLFIDEFRILLGPYDPGLLGLYQLVHRLVRTSDAKSWMATVDWINSGRNLQYPHVDGKSGKGSKKRGQSLLKPCLKHFQQKLIGP